MKTTLEKVFETLNKVELKSEKIELGLVDDFDKWRKRANDVKQEAFSLLEKTETAFKAVVQNYGVALDAAEKAEKAAKDLGINAQPFSKKVEDMKVNVKEFSKYTKLK